jgi:hypothetical protein
MKSLTRNYRPSGIPDEVGAIYRNGLEGGLPGVTAFAQNFSLATGTITIAVDLSSGQH